MKVLDRYLLKEIIPSFLISLAFIIFLLFMNEIFYLAEIFIARGVPFKIVLRILFYLLPSVLALALPLAFMAGVLGGLARLSSDRETEAMKVLGITAGKMLKPVFLAGFFLWLISLVFTFYLTPAANYRWLQTMVNSVLSRVNLEVEPGRFVESLPGKVVFVEKQREDGRFEKVFLFQQENPEKTQVILARSGEIVLETEKNEARLLLENGKNYDFSLPSPETIALSEFQKLEQRVDLSQMVGRFSLEKKGREKNIKELWRDWRRFQKEGREGDSGKRITLIEIHKRLSLPATCLIFVFLGVGLGWRRWPGGRLGGYGLSLVLIMAYYFLLVIGEQRALSGRQPAWLAMWLPDFLILLFGLYFYFSACRKKESWVSSSREKIKLFLAKTLGRRKKAEEISAESEEAGSFLHPSLLDRYIISRFVSASMAIFLALLFIMILVNFLQRMELVRENEKPVRLLLLFIWYKMPEFILFTFLVTVLSASVLTLSYFYRKNEIPAMITSGISYYRVVAPLLIVSLLLIPLFYFFQDRLVSRNNLRAEKIWDMISDRPARTFTYMNRYWIRGKDSGDFYHYDLLDPAQKVLSRLMILEADRIELGLKKITYAQVALIQRNELELKNGWIREFMDGVSRFSRFEFSRINLKEAEDYFLKEWKEPPTMTLTELRHYSEDLERTGSPARRFRLEAEFRKAFPLSVLILTLLSVASVGLAGQKGFIFPLALSLVAGFLYWEAMAIFRSLCMARVLSPFLASWEPQIIFLLGGIYLLLKGKT
jgi:LPS export ABC transporter permease LptF/LPS export ABC transporter permease LptG